MNGFDALLPDKLHGAGIFKFKIVLNRTLLVDLAVLSTKPE
jgi:hypothetical protein